MNHESASQREKRSPPAFVFWVIAFAYAVVTVAYFFLRGTSEELYACNGGALEHFLCGFSSAGVPLMLLVVAPLALLIVYVVAFKKQS